MSKWGWFGAGYVVHSVLGGKKLSEWTDKDHKNFSVGCGVILGIIVIALVWVGIDKLLTGQSWREYHPQKLLTTKDDVVGKRITMVGVWTKNNDILLIRSSGYESPVVAVMLKPGTQIDWKDSSKLIKVTGLLEMSNNNTDYQYILKDADFHNFTSISTAWDKLEMSHNQPENVSNVVIVAPPAVPAPVPPPAVPPPTVKNAPKQVQEKPMSVEPDKGTPAPVQPEKVASVPKPIETPNSVENSARDFPQPILRKQSEPEKNGKFLRNRIHFLALSKNGEKLVTASRDHNDATTVWDLVAGKPVQFFSERFKSVVVDKDGKWLFGAGWSNPNACVMWQLGSGGTEIRSFQGHTDEVSVVALTDDAKWLVTGSVDGSAKLWDVSTGKEIRTFRGPKGTVSSVVISGDAKSLITAINGNGIASAHLWDIDSGKEVNVYKERTMETIRSMALSLDDKSLVIGSLQGASLWDVATGSQIRTIVRGSIISVSLSSNGKLLATCSSYDNNVARVFDVATGNQVKTISGHVDWVFDVAFTNDCKRLVTCSTDGTTRFWDLTTEKQLFALVGFSDGNWAGFDFQGRFDGSDNGKLIGLTWPQRRQDHYTPGLLSKLTGFNQLP